MGLTTSPARRKAEARATTVSPGFSPSRISTTSPSARPLTIGRRTIRSPSPTTSTDQSPSCPARAEAGTATPSRLLDLDDGGREGADPRRRRRASAMRTWPSRLALSISLEISRTVPATASGVPDTVTAAAHAEPDPRQRVLGRLGVEVDRAVLGDAEQGVAAVHRQGTEPGGAAADDPGDRRPDLACGRCGRRVRGAVPAGCAGRPRRPPGPIRAPASCAAAARAEAARWSSVDWAMTPGFESAWRGSSPPGPVHWWRRIARWRSAPGPPRHRRAPARHRFRRPARRAGCGRAAPAPGPRATLSPSSARSSVIRNPSICGPTIASSRAISVPET